MFRMMVIGFLVCVAVALILARQWALSSAVSAMTTAWVACGPDGEDEEEVILADAGVDRGRPPAEGPSALRPYAPLVLRLRAGHAQVPEAAQGKAISRLAALAAAGGGGAKVGRRVPPSPLRRARPRRRVGDAQLLPPLPHRVPAPARPACDLVIGQGAQQGQVPLCPTGPVVGRRRERGWTAPRVPSSVCSRRGAGAPIAKRRRSARTCWSCCRPSGGSW